METLRALVGGPKFLHQLHFYFEGIGSIFFRNLIKYFFSVFPCFSVPFQCSLVPLSRVPLPLLRGFSRFRTSGSRITLKIEACCTKVFYIALVLVIKGPVLPLHQTHTFQYFLKNYFEPYFFYSLLLLRTQSTRVIDHVLVGDSITLDYLVALIVLCFKKTV